MTPREIRKLCKEVGLEYMRRDRGASLVRLPGDAVTKVVSVEDAVLNDWQTARVKQGLLEHWTRSYFSTLAEHATEAARLNVMHLYADRKTERRENGMHSWIYRSTLCGKRWFSQVTNGWSSYTVHEARDGGCMHCRVLLDRALEQDRVTITVHMDWKDT